MLLNIISYFSSFCVFLFLFIFLCFLKYIFVVVVVCRDAILPLPCPFSLSFNNFVWDSTLIFLMLIFKENEFSSMFGVVVVVLKTSSSWWFLYSFFCSFHDTYLNFVFLSFMLPLTAQIEFYPSNFFSLWDFILEGSFDETP